MPDRFGPATDAFAERMTTFVSLLGKWQGAHNLVAHSTLRELGSRHIEDSLQLVPLAPRFGRWIDLGTGAGFPGLVVAIAFADDPTKDFILVEANIKKCAFLRAAVRATAARAEVVTDRIESFGHSWDGDADVISARAVAPLDRLCALAFPLFRTRTTMLLLKGQDFVHENEAASKSWRYDLIMSRSATDPSGLVAQIRNLQPRPTR